ncbi:MAG: hypothetical protein H8D67_00705 [Deltaproteobacteria bacterium]|nr:hypothetical protein [Deltaproteobacteria bacterium]
MEATGWLKMRVPPEGGIGKGADAMTVNRGLDHDCLCLEEKDPVQTGRGRDER